MHNCVVSELSLSWPEHQNGTQCIVLLSAEGLHRETGCATVLTWYRRLVAGCATVLTWYRRLVADLLNMSHSLRASSAVSW